MPICGGIGDEFACRCNNRFNGILIQPNWDRHWFQMGVNQMA